MFDILYWGDKTYERGYDLVKRLELRLPLLSFKYLIRRENTEKPSQFLPQSKMVVLPYRFMAVRPPLTLIESMAYGKCVITSHLGGNEEIIKDGYNGFMVDFDLDYVCFLVNGLIENTPYRQHIEKRAKETIHRLYSTQDYERIINAYACV